MADTNPADQAFTISVLRGTGTTVEARTLTRAELWARLAEHTIEPVKTNAEAFVPGEIAPCPTPCRNAGRTRAVDCGGGQRHRLAANVRSVSLFVVDVDGWPQSRVDDCLTALDATGLAYVYTTSYSHRPPDECCARIVFPLSRPYAVTDPKHWRTTVWPALMRQVGIDPASADSACSDPSRLYFLPSVPNEEARAQAVTVTREGRAIDADTLPVPAEKPHLALVAPIDQAAVRRSATRDAVLSRALAGCADNPSDLELLDAVAQGMGFAEGSRHNRLNRVLWVLAKHSGADDPSILAALAPSLAAFGDDEDWHAEAERSLEGARSKIDQLDAEDLAFEALINEQRGDGAGYAARFVRLHGAETTCTDATGFSLWDGQRWAADPNASRALHCGAGMAESYEADLEQLEASLRILTERLRLLGVVPIGLSEAETRQYGESRAKLGEHAERLAEKISKFRARVITPCRQTHTIRAFLDQVKPQVLTTVDAFDADPWALNCTNGMVNLRTGLRTPHDPAALCTKLAPVAFDPDASAPLFERVLSEALPDPAVRAFFHRVIGYSLTGDVSEHLLFLLLGSGGNGKSTLLNAISQALGDYAGVAPKSLLMRGGKLAQPKDHELADLRGRRFLQVMELNEREYLDSSRLKAVVGGDRITAARKYENAITFEMHGKVLMPCNSLPRITDDDHGAWRRIALIQFPNAFLTDETRDRTIPERLRAEAEGILAWAVRGCLEWQRLGLAVPEACRKAVAEYREGENDVAQWVLWFKAERGEHGSLMSGELYRAYVDWANAAQVQARNLITFGRRLKNIGFRQEHTKAGNRWVW